MTSGHQTQDKLTKFKASSKFYGEHVVNKHTICVEARVIVWTWWSSTDQSKKKSKFIDLTKQSSGWLTHEDIKAII